MDRTLTTAGLLAGLLLLPAPATPSQDAPPERALEAPSAGARVDAAIGADELEAHVRFLASDELEGRFTGSPGGAAAADYLAATLARLVPHGLEPAGDDGTFLQDVGLDGVSFERLPEAVVDPGGAERALVYGADFELRTGVGIEREVTLRVVADLAAFEAQPDPAVALVLSGSGQELGTFLSTHGHEGWGALIEHGSIRARRALDDPTRIRRVRRGVGAPQVVVHGDARALLVDGTRLALRIGGRVGTAHNVVAVLRGTAPEEGREAIVLSAHYDHLRPRAPRPAGAVADSEAAKDEDLIHNGADDDASGVAALLEVVEAVVLSGQRPERDLVVLLATGEEIGLVGTSRYLDAPVVPLERTACNLNLEMIGRPDALAGGPGKLWLTGWVLTNVGQAAADAGLDVVPDPHPEQHFFQRSDNYAFVLQGVVGQTLSSYDLHEDYHRVTDEADTLDYGHLEAGARVAHGLLDLLLDADFAVRWAEGFVPPRR